MKKICFFILIVKILYFPCTGQTSEYSGGVFTLTDTSGLYQLTLTFNTADASPQSHGLREESDDTHTYKMEMNWFGMKPPYQDALVTWAIDSDHLFGTGASLSASNSLWDWSSRTGITFNPFRMEIGRYYRLVFTVNDSTTFSGRRTVYFYFALEHPKEEEKILGALAGLDPDPVIIPPDERIPALFTFHVINRDTRVMLPGETLEISLADRAINGRLEGDGQSGSMIQVTSDEKGKTGFTYVYLGDPPADAYRDVLINIRSEKRGIADTVLVKAGLKLKVTDIYEAWDDRTGLPRTFGFRTHLENALDPSLGIRNIYTDTAFYGGDPIYIGLALKTRWLNPPEQKTLDDFRQFIQVYPYSPDITLYDGIAWYREVAGNPVVTALSEPFRSMGEYDVPAVILKGQGIHVLEVSLLPYVLGPVDFSSQTPPYTGWGPAGQFKTDYVVKSAPFPPAYVCADVYAGESAFQSAVCAFEPTDTQQFLLKTILLDNPLLQNLPYAKAVLTVQDVAGVLCDFMKGDVLKVAQTIGNKYISGIEGLHKDGMITLTDSELLKLKINMYVQSLKKICAAGWSAYQHFNAKETTPMAYKTLEQPQTRTTDMDAADDFPESLDLWTFTDTIHQWGSGLFLTPDLAGHDAVIVMGEDAGTVTDMPEHTIASEGDEVSVYLLPQTGGSLSLAVDSDVRIVHFQSIHSLSARVRTCEVITGHQPAEILISAGGDTVFVDSGRTGTFDRTITPETTTYTSRDLCTTPPEAVTLTAPLGTITGTAPVLTWEHNECATWYQVYLAQTQGAYKFIQWYETEENSDTYPDAACTDGVCTVTPAAPLGAGDYEWWIRTWNEHGNGEWSQGMSFTVQGADSPPGKIQLVSPFGKMIGAKTLFTWNADAAATWYRLFVQENANKRNKFSQWYEISDNSARYPETRCSNGTCSVTVDRSFSGGTFTGWVMGWNDQGAGEWSDGLKFTVEK